MKPITRLTTLLVILLSLCLIPMTSAAGDESGDGQPGTSGSTGSDNGSGTSSGSSTGSGGNSGDGSGGGTQGPAGVSVPRVMVEGFSVEPQVVFAGQEFTVNFSLRNTSTTTRVQNLKVTVASPDTAFLPVGGSSSLFVSRIRAERVSGQSMTFRALPSLEAKPYQLTIAVEYEDALANAYESTETLAIEVNQELRADASIPQVTPEMLTVGQQASMTFTIQNQGKSKLFNAKATIAEGQALAPAEAFIGSIDPGTSGAVDLTVTANEPATGPIDVVVSYEDVTGEPFTFTRQVDLSISEAQPQEEYPGEIPEPEPEPAGFPFLPLVAVVVVVALLVTALLIARAARKRRAAREDAESLAALSGDNLIGDDWQ
ncbi:hypothetical protein SAMN02745244_01931 [Tessaracoccus bendigoensis DSM 12906]|uniref:CARDB protein n=1 Tax=Tessaracoccus bendigoensis DSM 12906 TaxID=1123357 RepID=A0A1M6HAP9_9ACTN|nr:hypothetical protein [Tessaracoccus bendigoensis]SHJ19169.1 hypothetical protein SAMN02745244_01931 [Tessaracoccus bendigoensis DSM 12906]